MTDSTEFLCNEKPRISDAVKNLLTILTASLKTASEEDRRRYVREGRPERIEEILQLSRGFLKTIDENESKKKFPNPIEFERLYPQTKSQSAVERLDQVAEYKVLYVLVQRIRRAERAKCTKLLGKSYCAFLLRYPLCFRFEERFCCTMEKKGVTKRKSTWFLNAVRYSLRCGEGNVEERLLDPEYAKLVWSEDFKRDLSKVQSRRFQHASKASDTKNGSTTDDSYSPTHS